MRKLFIFAACLLVQPALAGDDLRVLPKTINGAPAERMMQRYLLAQADGHYAAWRAEYEKRLTPEQVAAYQKERRDFFVKQLGGFPERTPLNAKVTGVVEREGYRVEKIVFESQPRHYVTAAFFIPDASRFKPPYPGVLVVCGHSANGKAEVAYQSACALLALNGIAALIVDPIFQGERYQLVDQAGKLLINSSTTGHTLVAVGSIPLGRNTALFEIWDGMRGIDYLQSRDIIDGKKIGCMGNSGGGTQTAYLMALDDRIQCAAPSCYITSFERLLNTLGPQDGEQNIFGQVKHGMDHADYLMMRAPIPTLVCCATHDYFDQAGTWQSFRYASRLYARLGHGERMAIFENDDKHGWKKPIREAATRWMVRWLAGRNEAITEPKLDLLTDADLQCSPKGQVMLMEDARSVFDLNKDESVRLAAVRKKLWAAAAPMAMRAKVREAAGIRGVDDIPVPSAEKIGAVRRDGHELTTFTLQPEPGIWLPAALCLPAGKKEIGALTIILSDKGMASVLAPDGAADRLARSGRSVLAVDLRGVGETQPTGTKSWYAERFGVDGRDVTIAYLLGRSYVGMRTEDILSCVKWANKLGAKRPVDVIAHGHLCTPAVHAAALEPELFGKVQLQRPLVSWSNVVETPITQGQPVNLVHGALRVYDLPDLRRMLGERVSVEEPLDAANQPYRE